MPGKLNIAPEKPPHVFGVDSAPNKWRERATTWSWTVAFVLTYVYLPSYFLAILLVVFLVGMLVFPIAKGIIDYRRTLKKLERYMIKGGDLTQDGGDSPTHANKAEIAFVRATLAQLERLGIKQNADCEFDTRQYANLVVEGYNEPAPDESEQINRITDHAPFPALSVLWVEYDEQTQSRVHFFRNACVIGDHCYDVASLQNSFDTLSRILDLVQNEWPTEIESTQFDNDQIVFRLADHGTDLRITKAKDWDCTLFRILNDIAFEKSLPNRFGFIGDGGSILIVWLPLTEFADLNNFVGTSFEIPMSNRS